MHFDSVVGQQEIKNKLKHAIANGRISHAVLISGKTGYGILPLGMAYANEVLCHYAQDGQSARVKCDKLVHPDLHLFFPVNSTDSVKDKPVPAHFLAEFRSAFIENPYINLYQWLSYLGIENKQGLLSVYAAAEINQALALKSYEGGYKIVLIWMPERLNIAAANKLLKILEEPPEKSLFVLVSEEPEQLLPTILSRCQTIRVPPLSEKEIVEALKTRFGVEESAAKSIALMSDGDLTLALEAIGENQENLAFKSRFQEWMRMVYGRKIWDVIRFVDELSKMGRERQKQFLAYGLHIFRECLIANYGSASLSRLDGEEADFVSKFSPFINSANSLFIIDAFETASYHVERNANPKILFMDLSLHVMKRIRQKPEIEEQQV